VDENYVTVDNAAQFWISCGLLSELTEGKRNRLFIARELIDWMSRPKETPSSDSRQQTLGI
jgi:hypothetical protein